MFFLYVEGKSMYILKVYSIPLKTAIKYKRFKNILRAKNDVK